MRVVAAEAPPGLVEQRRRLGHDRYDEMWEGVLHMNAVPHGDHQEFALQLGSWLLRNWSQRGVRKAFPDRNVALPGGWPNNYRIPDLVLTTAERFSFDQGTHIEGPPLVVVEIHSPHDEAYEKLAFYAQLGVPEVWIIDRDTKQPEIFTLQQSGDGYDAASPNADGWLTSFAAGIEMMATPEEKLAIRLTGQAATQAAIPDD